MLRRANVVSATLVLFGLVALYWKPVNGFSRAVSSGNSLRATATQSGTEGQAEEPSRERSLRLITRVTNSQREKRLKPPQLQPRSGGVCVGPGREALG